MSTPEVEQAALKKAVDAVLKTYPTGKITRAEAGMEVKRIEAVVRALGYVKRSEMGTDPIQDHS